MPFPAKAVANEFLTIAEAHGKELTPMKLQKLVYFAHGWFLAWTGGPLIKETVQAWQYGPVIPSLYAEFREYGNAPISAKACGSWFNAGLMRVGTPTLDNSTADPVEVGKARELIQKVWDLYGGYSSIRLSNATHVADGPWYQAYKEGIKAIPIPNENIKKYFQGLAHAAER